MANIPTFKIDNSVKIFSTPIQITDITLDSTATNNITVKYIINNAEEQSVSKEVTDNAVTLDIDNDKFNSGINTIKITITDNLDNVSEECYMQVIKLKNSMLQSAKSVKLKEIEFNKEYSKLKTLAVSNGNIQIIYKVKDEYLTEEELKNVNSFSKIQPIVLLNNDAELKAIKLKAYDELSINLFNDLSEETKRIGELDTKE